jgi:hypothetical protein
MAGVPTGPETSIVFGPSCAEPPGPVQVMVSPGYDPDVVGVPAIAPVEESNASPGGSAPVSAHEVIEPVVVGVKS